MSIVNNCHDTWSEELSEICFTITSRCSLTRKTASFHNFGRELSTIDHITYGFYEIINNDNFVVEMIPYLKKLDQFTSEAKEVLQEQKTKVNRLQTEKRETCSYLYIWRLCFCYKTKHKQKEYWR